MTSVEELNQKLADEILEKAIKFQETIFQANWVFCKSDPFPISMTILGMQVQVSFIFDNRNLSAKSDLKNELKNKSGDDHS